MTRRCPKDICVLIVTVRLLGCHPHTTGLLQEMLQKNYRRPDGVWRAVRKKLQLYVKVLEIERARTRG
jgi:hypothetical protein